MKEKISITMDKCLLKGIDSLVDNISIRNRSQAIGLLIRQFLGENKTAVILAGGSEESLKIGSKNYRMTAKLGDSTVIEHAVKKLRNSGFKAIYIIAQQNVLTKIFSILKDGSEYGVKLNYTEEKASKGTASSLRLLQGKVNDTFLVVYGDIIFNSIKLNELWAAHQRARALTTLTLTTSNKPAEKGTVVMEGNNILEFLQKPKTSQNYLVFSPIFIAEPEIFSYGGDILEVDVFPTMAKKGLLNGYISSVKEKHIHTKSDLQW